MSRSSLSTTHLNVTNRRSITELYCEYVEVPIVFLSYCKWFYRYKMHFPRHSTTNSATLTEIPPGARLRCSSGGGVSIWNRTFIFLLFSFSFSFPFLCFFFFNASFLFHSMGLAAQHMVEWQTQSRDGHLAYSF
jgi:hypothetical protein